MFPQTTILLELSRWTARLLVGLANVAPTTARMDLTLRPDPSAAKKTWDFERDEPGKIVVYKVQDGKRTQFQSAKIPGDDKWHTLRVTMSGTKIACYLDGQKHLEVLDATFSEAGTIRLWSKADAQSYFDDLTVSE